VRTKNLLKGKPEGGFPGLAAVLLSFGLAFAVIAASVMVAAGCDSLAGEGGNEAVVAEESVNAGGATAFSAAAFRTIKIKFEVLNGGWGLSRSEGIVGTQDNSYLVHGDGICANDYTITLPVPASDEYLNIYWMGYEPFATQETHTWVRAKTKAESGTITIDYNEEGRNGHTGYTYPYVVTKNLYGVECLDSRYKGISEWWNDLKKRVGSSMFAGGRQVKIKFEVKNGGTGLWWSEGIVSWQDDSYLEYAKASCANDFTITLPVPQDDEYLNIRWFGKAFAIDEGTLVKAKVKAESGTITLDYNGTGKVAAKNLYDVQVGRVWDYDKMGKSDILRDWEDAEKRAVKD